MKGSIVDVAEMKCQGWQACTETDGPVVLSYDWRSLNCRS